MRRQRRTADNHGIGIGHSIHDDVVGVLADEAIEIARIVGVELALGEWLGIEGVCCGHVPLTRV